MVTIPCDRRENHIRRRAALTGVQSTFGVRESGAMLTAGVTPMTAPPTAEARGPNRSVATVARAADGPALAQPFVSQDDPLATLLRRAVTTRSILARTPAYRHGGKTAMNLTPRDPQDITATPQNGGRLGLSCTETAGKGLTFPGGKASIRADGFDVEDDPTTDDPLHFLVRPGPGQGSTLQAWAAQRAATKQPDRSTWHPLTARLWELTDMKGT
jgi:hypothetical protein